MIVIEPSQCMSSQIAI